MEWTLEIVLVVLLGATLFQAIRLERALGVLKRDRASLESLVVGFNTSTHQAESGIEQLRAAADGTGRAIEAQLSKSEALKEDLAFLTERGDRLADRLDRLVRAARMSAQDRDVHDRDAANRDAPNRDAPNRDAPNRDAPNRDAQDKDAKVRDGQGPAGSGKLNRKADTSVPPGTDQVERDLLQALRMAR